MTNNPMVLMPDGMLCHPGSAQRPYQCSACRRNFKTRGGMEQHQREKHWGWYCNGCGKTFHTGMGLRQHREDVHAGQGQP